MYVDLFSSGDPLFVEYVTNFDMTANGTYSSTIKIGALNPDNYSIGLSIYTADGYWIEDSDPTNS